MSLILYWTSLYASQICSASSISQPSTIALNPEQSKGQAVAKVLLLFFMSGPTEALAFFPSSYLEGPIIQPIYEKVLDKRWKGSGR